MITTTLKGAIYRKKFSDEIEQAMQDVKERWSLANPCEDKALTDEDFCIFVRENGRMVLLKNAYAKMSKTKKKFIERSYEYRQIPE